VIVTTLSASQWSSRQAALTTGYINADTFDRIVIHPRWSAILQQQQPPPKRQTGWALGSFPGWGG
jgi:hypothetical protein